MRHGPPLSRSGVTLAGIAAASLLFLSSASNHRTLTFEARVAAQEAIERVYYSHLIGKTRSFEQAVPRELLEKKVHLYLQQSAALERIWRTPVTAAMLKAEAERIATSTGMPDRLRELYVALGDDPVLIQECLVRPALVDRMARRLLAGDRPTQGPALREATEIGSSLASGRLPATEGEMTWDEWLPTVQRELQDEDVPTVADPTVSIGLISNQPQAAVSCEGDRWDNRSLGVPGIIPAGGRPVWTGTHLIIWGGVDVPSEKYDPVTDSWVPIATQGAPYPQLGSTAVWTGSEMIVYGAVSGTPYWLSAGGRYDPQTDTWRSMSFAGQSMGRIGHTAVWTGSKMVVSGGHTLVMYGPHYVLSSQIGGGSYDPATDTWSPGPYFNRSGHTAVWTGTKLILWGGQCMWSWWQENPCAAEDSRIGKVVDLATGSSFPTTSLNAPSPPGSYSTVWSGSEMIIWGGGTTAEPGGTAAGHRYNPASNTWSDMSQTNAPAARYAHSAVWTGDEMIVWGGSQSTSGGPVSRLSSGGRYDPVNDAWWAMSDTGAPAPMSGHAAAWTGQVMIVWGGDPVTRGRYDPAADQWIPSGLLDPYVPLPRTEHAVVWTGNEMIVWDGRGPGAASRSGDRYDPALDSWRGMSMVGAPSATGPTVIWTGDHMIVWGGADAMSRGMNTGGLYDPTSDTWAVTSLTGAPEGRTNHTAVWTGSEMIVWGGVNCRPTDTGCLVVVLDTGGRYDPVADRWRPTATTAAPQARSRHTAVWSGSRMLIWGGCTPALTPGLSTIPSEIHGCRFPSPVHRRGETATQLFGRDSG